MLRIPKCDKLIEIHDGVDVEITEDRIVITAKAERCSLTDRGGFYVPRVDEVDGSGLAVCCHGSIASLCERCGMEKVRAEYLGNDVTKPKDISQ